MGVTGVALVALPRGLGVIVKNPGRILCKMVKCEGHKFWICS